MKSMTLPSRQQGVSLIVALIMLLLFTLLVSSGFNLSNSNMQAVGNMQIRHEAIAAANSAIEQVVSSSFTAAPAAQNIDIDLNNDNVADYTVAIGTPDCIRATQAAAASLSSVSLQAMSSYSTWNTVWSLTAQVSDPASGAMTRVRSGIRVLLSQTEKDAVCP